MLVKVDVGNLDFDLLTDGKNILGFCNSVVGDLGDVDKTVNAGDDVRKSAEGSHADNFNLRGGTDGIISLEDFPGVVLFLFVAEADFLVLLVNVLYEYLKGIADLNNVGGVRNAQPGKFGNMNHTVNAAEVNKCAVGGEGFDFSGIGLTDFDGIPECSLLCLSFFGKNAADGTDSAFTLGVHFKNSESYILFEESFEGLVSGGSGLRSRDENRYTIGNGNDSALNYLCNDSFKDFVSSGCVLYALEVLFGIDLFLGKDHSAFGVINLDNFKGDDVAYFDDISRLYIGVVGEFFRRNESGVFATDADDDFGVFNYHNGGFDLIAVSDVLGFFVSEGLLKHFPKVVFFYSVFTHGL